MFTYRMSTDGVTTNSKRNYEACSGRQRNARAVLDELYQKGLGKKLGKQTATWQGPV
jgi:hypothetical protein